MDTPFEAETASELAAANAAKLSEVLTHMATEVKAGFFEIANKFLDPYAWFAVLGIAFIAKRFNEWRQGKQANRPLRRTAHASV